MYHCNAQKRAKSEHISAKGTMYVMLCLKFELRDIAWPWSSWNDSDQFSSYTRLP
jgi:hypothetical protein